MYASDSQRSDDGSRKKRSAPQRMGDVIPQLMARRGYSRLLSHDDFNDVWMQISGPLSEHSRPGRFRRGVLEVIVGNSAVMQELNFRKRQLLKLLQQSLPDHKITDLRFSVGNF